MILMSYSIEQIYLFNSAITLNSESHRKCVCSFSREIDTVKHHSILRSLKATVVSSIKLDLYNSGNQVLLLQIFAS